MELLLHVLEHALEECIKMLPFLFLGFLLIEALEHYSTAMTEKLLKKVGKAGPVVGAVAGCFPQCGFSVMASNLYAGGIISVGTLLAVFIATSDEAVLIMLSNPGKVKEVMALLIAKIVIAIAAGYIVDIVFGRYISEKKNCGDLCGECGCHEHNAGIIKPALRHTFKIFIYLFVFTVTLNFAVEVLGIEKLSEYLLRDSILQPAIAALIGLIPNCAASVILTQLYLNGAISFASVIAGLCTGAGVGMVVLFKMNRNKKENLKILGTLYVIAVVAGIILQCV